MAKQINPQVGKTYRRNGQAGLTGDRHNVTASELVVVFSVSSNDVQVRLETGMLRGRSFTFRKSDFTTKFFNENSEY